MSLLTMSDAEIQKLARPIIIDTIIGAQNKDWEQFAKHMPAEDFSNQEIRTDVERQWDEHAYLTEFSEDAEFLAVIRKKDCVLVAWRLTSTISSEEYLEKLYLEELDGVIVQTGIWTD